MATIKHIASKSSDYSAAESYLIFQHDEYRNIPILDDRGQKILRESYLVDTLECGDEDYAMACIYANKKFGVNAKTGDIKSHHYIISFDPRDSTDNGLTMEKAQALGLEFCKKHFPGHPAIVATHPDGHNHSGNIHVHIVINILRIRDVERLPFMEKSCDWQAGKKHRCTASMLRYLQRFAGREGVFDFPKNRAVSILQRIEGAAGRAAETANEYQRFLFKRSRKGAGSCQIETSRPSSQIGNLGREMKTKGEQNVPSLCIRATVKHGTPDRIPSEFGIFATVRQESKPNVTVRRATRRTSWTSRKNRKPREERNGAVDKLQISRLYI